MQSQHAMAQQMAAMQLEIDTKDEAAQSQAAAAQEELHMTQLRLHLRVNSPHGSNRSSSPDPADTDAARTSVPAPEHEQRKRDPWGKNNRQPSGKSPLDDLLKQARKLLGTPGQMSRNILTGIIVLLVVGLLLSSYTIIEARQVGLVLRFGEVSRQIGPGFHFKLPQPIEMVSKVDAARVRSVNDKITLLTRDQNVIAVDFTVQYQVDDARKYLFSLNDPDGTVQAAAEAAVRGVIGANTMDQIMVAGGSTLVAKARDTLQQTLDVYNAGMKVTDISFQSVAPPKEVKDAFDDVNNAREDKQSSENAAQAYASKVLPVARGDASQIAAEAEGYKAERIALPHRQRRPGVRDDGGDAAARGRRAAAGGGRRRGAAPHQQRPPPPRLPVLPRPLVPLALVALSPPIYTPSSAAFAAQLFLRTTNLDEAAASASSLSAAQATGLIHSLYDDMDEVQSSPARPVVSIMSDDLDALAELANGIITPTTFDLGGRELHHFFAAEGEANPGGMPALPEGGGAGMGGAVVHASQASASGSGSGSGGGGGTGSGGGGPGGRSDVEIPHPAGDGGDEEGAGSESSSGSGSSGRRASLPSRATTTNSGGAGGGDGDTSRSSSRSQVSGAAAAAAAAASAASTSSAAA
ncbi:MAG: hypothetical protein WDW36_003437 [Sanguina aurantia]